MKPIRSAVVPIASLTLLLTGLSGCGLILGGGSRQTIQVQTSPADTKVSTTPETGEYTAPTTLDLKRNTDYTIRFAKDGYSPASIQLESHVRAGYVVADVLLTGLVGVVVDAASGGWSKLSPESASVTLTKVAMQPGPDSVTVGLTLHRAGDRNRVDVRSSAPGVVLDVLPAKR
ncbi:MAG TPA: hypothetical protein VIC55_03250 [Gemmatimonadaceae bacterium]|jgi:hypothetical protein